MKTVSIDGDNSLCFSNSLKIQPKAEELPKQKTMNISKCCRNETDKHKRVESW